MRPNRWRTPEAHAARVERPESNYLLGNDERAVKDFSRNPARCAAEARWARERQVWSPSGIFRFSRSAMWRTGAQLGFAVTITATPASVSIPATVHELKVRVASLRVSKGC
jgi:hypothetical protein